MFKFCLVLLATGFIQSSAAARGFTCNGSIGNVSTFAAVYFGYDSLNILGKFNLVVLDPPDYTPEAIARLKSLKCMPFAYVDIGESETYRSDFSLVDTSILLAPDPDWQDRYYVDIGSAKWQELILDERIPRILKSGYCGLFLDLSGLLEDYPQMDKSAAALIERIRKRFPNTRLILDDGLDIVNRVGNLIDGVAVEGLIGYYDFDSDSYRIRGDLAISRLAMELTSYAKKFRLRIFVLDYAAADDGKTRDDIIIQSRKFGFAPYVGTVELDTLFLNTVYKIKLPVERKVVQPADR